MCMEKTPWEKAVEFHGHACPGLAIGYKAAEAAAGFLGNNRDVDEETVAIVENDSCAVDGIQSVLSCTAGKGNLIFRNNGKHVYTFGLRKAGKSLRVALRFGVMAGGVQGESREDKINRILKAEPDELFDIKEIDDELPQRAVIFNTVQCSRCGEGVMESKARLSGGKVVCPDCFQEYTRGW